MGTKNTAINDGKATGAKRTDYNAALDASLDATKANAETYQQASDAAHAQKQDALSTGKTVYEEQATWENPQKQALEDVYNKQEEGYKKLLSANTPMSAEQEEKERKRRKRAAVWSAVGDGIAAIASLGSTIHYGEPFKGDKTLSERQQERWKEMDAARKDKDALYYNVLAKYGDSIKDRYDQAAKKQKDKWDAQLGAANIDVSIAQDKEDRAKEHYTIAGDVIKKGEENTDKKKKAADDERQLQNEEKRIKIAQAKAYSGGSGGSGGSNKKGNTLEYTDDTGKRGVFKYTDEEKGIIVSYASALLRALREKYKNKNLDDNGKRDLRTLQAAIATNDDDKICTAYGTISAKYVKNTKLLIDVIEDGRLRQRPSSVSSSSPGPPCTEEELGGYLMEKGE